MMLPTVFISRLLQDRRASGIQSDKANSPAPYYRWLVVAACFAVTLTLGETFWSFGVFFKPLENEFGWSRSTVSLGYTAFLVGYAVSVVGFGRLADRYGGQRILFLAAVLSGLGIALCSQIQNIYQLCALLFVAGLGGGATWSVPTSVVQGWFYGKPRAGVALGIVSAGVGVGALIFAPLINYLILNYDWRRAYLVVGIIFLVVIGLGSFVIKSNPENPKWSARGKKPADSPIWSTARVIKTRAFAAIVFFNCIAAFTFQTLSVHLVPHATDIQISATAAATALGLMGAISVPSRILAGSLAERIGWQKVMALSFFGVTLALIWLLFLTTESGLYAFALFYGIFHGGRNVALAGIMGSFFGLGSLGELIGIGNAMGQVGGVFAPYLAGAIYDATNSYVVIFVIIAVLALAAGLVAVMTRKPEIKPG